MDEQGRTPPERTPEPTPGRAPDRAQDRAPDRAPDRAQRELKTIEVPPVVVIGGEASPPAPGSAPPAAGGRSAGGRPASNWPAVARTAVIGVIVAVVLLGGLLIVLTAAGRTLSSLNPFRDGVIENRTIDRSGHAVVKSITELGQLKAASGYYEVVVDVEQDVKPLPSFLAGRRTLFVAAGSVDATVDLSDLGDDAITMNEDRTAVTVTVPAPVVGQPALDLQRSHVWGSSRGVIDRLRDAFGDGADDDPAGLQAVYQEGARRIGEAATGTPDLTQRAQDSTTATLTGLLHGLGFTDVTVVFEKPDQR